MSRATLGAVASIALASLSGCAAQNAVDETPPSSATSGIRIHGDIVHLEGRIDEAMWTAFKALEPGKISMVVLDSLGGRISGAYAMGNSIREYKVRTHVNNGDQCYSACTIIYQAGIERTAGINARFLYHPPNKVNEESSRLWSASLKEKLESWGMSTELTDQIWGQTAIFSGYQLIPHGVVQKIENKRY